VHTLFGPFLPTSVYIFKKRKSNISKSVGHRQYIKKKFCGHKYIHKKKIKRFQINNLTMYIKDLEKWKEIRL
jgi:hypothetical protein